MNRNSDMILAEILRLILLLLVAGSIYILYYVDMMRCSGKLFLIAYNSVPYMFEHILAGVAVFLAFCVARIKISEKLYDKGGRRE